MSASPNEIEARARTILRSSRIRGRVVVLCEGHLKAIHGRPSPQAYRQLGKMPDANFYFACVPRWWAPRLRPAFFNCGDRQGVIDTYEALHEAHAAAPEASYLTPARLFALVDLDLQPSRLPASYPHETTEDVFKALYDQDRVATDVADEHRIWVTGLVHKEAYFLLPPAQSVFDDHRVRPFVGGAPVSLPGLWETMARELHQDADFTTWYSKIRHRSAFHPALDGETPTEWRERWLAAFQAADADGREGLAWLLLLFAKAKPYWKRITPDPAAGSTIPAHTYRSQLSLEIGRAISELDRSSGHHLQDFFQVLARA